MARKIAKSSKKQETFIVEKILKKKIIGGKPQYLVKWLNFPSKNNTWEPETSFAFNPHLLKEFNGK